MTFYLGDKEQGKAENLGWTCPKCNSIYSPNVIQCTKCQKNEQTESGKQLLTENEGGS